MMKKLDKNFLVVQSNKLVEARYVLTLGEQRLILTMISLIQPDDEDFKDYIISLPDLAGFLGIKSNNFYSEVQKITQRLMKRVLQIKEPDGLLQINWISSAKYIGNEANVLLSFDPKLKPYLLLLKKQFTKYKLNIIARFKSIYSVRIYQLLKQYELVGSRKFHIKELREILGISENEYKQYNDFKRRVLISARKEIAEKSDVKFDFDEIKEGRRINYIKFIIKQQPYQDVTSSDFPQISGSIDIVKNNQENSLIRMLIEHEIPDAKAKRLFEEYGEEHIRNNLKLFESDLQVGKVKKSKGGYLYQAIIENWAYKNNYGIETKKEVITDTIITDKVEAKSQETKKQKRNIELRNKAFSNLTEIEQIDVFEEFKSSPFTSSFIRGQVRGKGLEKLSSHIVKTEFTSFLVMQYLSEDQQLND